MFSTYKQLVYRAGFILRGATADRSGFRRIPSERAIILARRHEAVSVTNGRRILRAQFPFYTASRSAPTAAMQAPPARTAM
jgi:hypothetical protein